MNELMWFTWNNYNQVTNTEDKFQRSCFQKEKQSLIWKYGFISGALAKGWNCIIKIEEAEAYMQNKKF